jgi:hypothetical protein
MRLDAVVGPSLAAPSVLLWCDRLKMRWITAGRVTTKVIDLEAIGDRAD